MDVLSDVLHRARVTRAVVHRSISTPPWSFRLADTVPLSVVASIDGGVAITPHARPPHVLEPGDIALITGGNYTLADDPTTPCRVVISNGRKSATAAGTADDLTRMTAPRTYGDPGPDATTMLHGIYELHGAVGNRLLELLPPLTVVPAGPRTRQPLEMLSAEAACDEPGQDAVLGRLLDLILVIGLRAWGANPGSRVPSWLAASADPAVGAALTALHADPRRRWTTAALANEAGVSRAAFCARFTALVGVPPIAYLTSWRMTLAADALRHNDTTVADIAHEVGYDNPFSFSTAFKRVHGQSPAAWRASDVSKCDS